MAKIGERIAEKAFEALEAAPEGLRYTRLVRRVIELDPSSRSDIGPGICTFMQVHAA